MLDSIIKEISKKYGKDADKIMYDVNYTPKPISSGSVIIDLYANGGLAIKGRLVELVGLESSGKTTLAMQSCRECVNSGFSAVYIDAERTFDHNYAKSIGLDIGDKFQIFQPRTAEELDELITIMNANLSKLNLGLVVIDSVSAIHSAITLQTGIGESESQASHARVWSKLSPKLKHFASLNDVAILLINQLRAKPMMDRNAKYSVTNSGVGFGVSNVDTSVTTTGGFALRYFLDARYLLSFSTHHKEEIDNDMTGESESIPMGNIISIKSIKSKINSPYRQAKFLLRYGVGTDDSIHLLDIAINKGLVKQTSSWLVYTTSKGEEIRENGKIKFLKRFSTPEVMTDVISILQKDLHKIFSESDGNLEELAKVLSKEDTVKTVTEYTM